MARTYSSTSSNDKDRVRELIVDTDQGGMRIDNEQINAALVRSGGTLSGTYADGTVSGGSVYVAALAMARLKHGLLALQPDKNISDLQITRNREAYKTAVIDPLVAITGGDAVLCTPFVGGASDSANEALEADTDLNLPTWDHGALNRTPGEPLS